MLISMVVNILKLKKMFRGREKSPKIEVLVKIDKNDYLYFAIGFNNDSFIL